MAGVLSRSIPVCVWGQCVRLRRVCVVASWRLFRDRSSPISLSLREVQRPESSVHVNPFDCALSSHCPMRRCLMRKTGTLSKPTFRSPRCTMDSWQSAHHAIGSDPSKLTVESVLARGLSSHRIATRRFPATCLLSSSRMLTTLYIARRNLVLTGPLDSATGQLNR